MSTMTPVQSAISRDEMSPDSSLEQSRIFDEVHRQQVLLEIKGQCEFGCDASCLIRAWAFSIKRRDDFTPGMMAVCRYTRLPCERARLGMLFELYAQLNAGARPLLFWIDGSTK